MALSSKATMKKQGGSLFNAIFTREASRASDTPRKLQTAIENRKLEMNFCLGMKQRGYVQFKDGGLEQHFKDI
eukprot:6494125-Karenia_brevis.AAC.1